MSPAQKTATARSATRPNPLGDTYVLAFVLAMTAVTYLGTLRFGFVYDDSAQVIGNPFIRSWHNLPAFFTTGLWSFLNPESPGNYYRPTFFVLSALNYSLFKLSPQGWHAMALLIHLGVTALVFFTIRKMLGRSEVAAIAALIFGVHPIHHEAVAWVSDTTESLFALFFIAAFFAYLKSREGRAGVWLSASCLLGALALFSKETAIVLPALVFAHAWIAGSADASGEARGLMVRLRQAMLPALSYIPAFLVYFAFRFLALRHVRATPLHASVMTYVFAWPTILYFYLKQWLIPIQFSEFYDVFAPTSFSWAHVALPALSVAAAAAAMWFGRKRLGAKETGFAAAWILIPLLPALNIAFFRPDEIVHDRYFYAPSVGAALVVALLLEPLARRGPLAFGHSVRLWAPAVALAGLLAASTVHAVSFWSDDLTLFTHTHEVAPLNVVTRNDLSIEWISAGKLADAQALLEGLINEDSKNATAWSNLGRLKYQQGRFAEAESDLEFAIGLRPDMADAYITLGQTQLKTGRAAEALVSVRRAAELNPSNPRYHTVYGIVLELTGDCRSAIAEFQAALALQPGEGITEREMDRCKAAVGAAASAAPASKP